MDAVLILFEKKYFYLFNINVKMSHIKIINHKNIKKV